MIERREFHVLVICTGNVCRSPVAECMLRQLLSDMPKVVVDSAGLAPPIGARPHPWSMEFAQLLGFQPTAEKRARMMTEVEARKADLVLVMERGQLDLINRRYPSLRGRVFLLGQWGEGEIADPINLPRSSFELITNQLYSACKAWAQRLHSVELDKLRS